MKEITDFITGHIKDILAFLGWLGTIIQFIIIRNYQKNDKLSERKFEAYCSFMKKKDEIMQNLNKNLADIVTKSKGIFSILLKNAKEQLFDEKLFIDYNNEMIDLVINATKPLSILRGELNTLLLICPADIKQKIDKLVLLLVDYNNELQKNLASIASNDSNFMNRELQTFGHDKRWLDLNKLNDEIVELMRDDLKIKKGRRLSSQTSK